MRCGATLLALLGALSRAAARDVFVSSSTGSDSADGSTLATAWKTLARLSSAGLKCGDTVLLRAGDAWGEPLVLAGPGSGCASGHMRGFIEAVEVNATSATVRGWVVDPGLPRNGTPPVAVRVEIDGAGVLDTVANLTRDDIPAHGMAPNAQHGLAAALPASAVRTLQKGKHRVDVFATGSAANCGAFAWRVPPNENTKQCVDNGVPCACTGIPGPATAPPPPLRVTSTDPWAKRPTIGLNASGVGITILGYDSVEVLSVEVSSATEGVVAMANGGRIGNLNVSDCAFRGVWNRSSIGQTIPIKGRNCGNGWTPSVHPANFANVTVSGCLFDNIDVAFLPAGPLGAVRFVGNTLTRANGNTILMTGKTDWLIEGCVFTKDDAPRFFQCGSTDIMVGQLGTTGAINANEIGWRGEHPASPDGCGIDYEGGSDGVAVTNNFIHDSYGAGVMVFGMSDRSRNISNAVITGNIFVRNGAQQTSDDHGEIAFMEHGSTGTCADNVFFADDTDPGFVFRERVNGTLALGWQLRNNTVNPVGAIPGSIADSPQVASLVFDASGVAQVAVVSRRNPPRNTTLLYTTDGSWPREGAPGTTAVRAPATIAVPRTAAVNARFVVPGLLPSMTTTLVVTVPPADFSG